MAVSTKKQIAAGHRRSLKAMSAKLVNMAAAWDEVDQYFLNLLGEAADKLTDVHDQLKDDLEDE